VLIVLVMLEVEMFKLVSKNRQRKYIAFLNVKCSKLTDQHYRTCILHMLTIGLKTVICLYIWS